MRFIYDIREQTSRRMAKSGVSRKIRTKNRQPRRLSLYKRDLGKPACQTQSICTLLQCTEIIVSRPDCLYAPLDKPSFPACFGEQCAEKPCSESIFLYAEAVYRHGTLPVIPHCHDNQFVDDWMSDRMVSTTPLHTCQMYKLSFYIVHLVYGMCL